jgi:phenylalanyl-tRNA synthetase alpha chain
MSEIAVLGPKYLAQIANTTTLKALDDVRVQALGKQGEVTGLLKHLATLPAAEKASFGAAVNTLKTQLEAAIAAHQRTLNTANLNQRLATETIDISRSPRQQAMGQLHPIQQTIDDMVSIFGAMGFSFVTGPDVEDDFHNFTALNFPSNHPARQMHDTFYLEPNAQGAQKLLRTHTSTVQIRHMMANPAPHKIIVAGRTYRSDFDATHTPMFHQMEGLVIDTNIHMGHLKGCLIDFCQAIFNVSNGEDLIRLRPSFFPFTEPSAEVDIRCKRSKGELTIGGGDDWLEILGCGMVHPNVISNCGLDPTKYQGFAFGMGIERIAMLKYGIPDLRTFFDSDLRWLRHYGFGVLNNAA